MHDLDHSLLYSEEVLTVYASRILEDAGVPLTVDTAIWANSNYVTIMAIDPNGKNVRLVAPIVEFQPGIISFRSVLKTHDMHAEWLPNGQAAGGCTEVVFFGETGPKLISDQDSMAAYYRSGVPEVRQDPAGYRGYMESVLQDRLKTNFYKNEVEVAYIDGERFPLVQSNINPAL